MARYLFKNPGPRPPFFLVAEHLWGANCDFDSDGDSKWPNSTDWTELTIAMRSAPYGRVDVDPLDLGGSLVLSIVSESDQLARRAAEFICRETGGELTSD